MPPALNLELLATAEAVPGVRRAVRAYVGDAPCADLQLCATELLANVIRHLGDGVPVTVRLDRVAHGRMRLEVTDPDPRALPVLCEAADGDETGRGLALLDALALRWGVEQGAGAKTVWCELREENRESAPCTKGGSSSVLTCADLRPVGGGRTLWTPLPTED